MRITIFSHGTRGDVWPAVALASLLAQREHDITLAVPGEFETFASSSGARIFALPFDCTAWGRTPEGQRALSTGRFRFVRRLAAEYDRHADAFDDAFESAAAGAEAIVSLIWTADRALAMADRLQVPMATILPYPLAPSDEYASLAVTNGRLPRPLRRPSHHLVLRAWWYGNAKAINRFRRRLGLPACSTPTAYRLMDANALTLHTFSPSLFPRPTDWPDNLKVTGAWEMPSDMRAAVGENLPDGLRSWLAAGPAPVFLGFGSMPILDPHTMLEGILAATHAVGRRAVIDGSWLPDDVALPESIFCVGPTDHDQLFRHCAAAVHHGGLGTTTASLRAGCPTMVCSVFADQPWWGEHLRRLGVGTHVPFRKLDRNTLTAGLRSVLEADVRARAQTLGEAIRAEGDGLPAATRLLDDWLVTGEPIPLPDRRRASRNVRYDTASML